MDYKEISAKTVEEAITAACLDLSVSSDRLEYEVLSEGSKGFFGIGSKPAAIRYRKIEEPAPEDKEEKPVRKKTEKKPVKTEHLKKEETVPEKETKEVTKEEEEKTERSGKSEKAEKTDRPRKDRRDKKARPKKEKQQPSEKKEPVKEKKEEPVIRTEEEVAVIREAAETFLSNVFETMQLPVEIKSEYVPESNCLEMELSGADMGMLIGKRGQTLDSLQYLTSLAVNRKVKEYVRIKIDTEDYRRRRKETLENLAKNIASKVKKTGKPVVLEPMNPYERRIIHSALQPNKYVETYSEGNEPYRHVVVAPKK